MVTWESHKTDKLPDTTEIITFPQITYVGSNKFLSHAIWFLGFIQCHSFRKAFWTVAEYVTNCNVSKLITYIINRTSDFLIFTVRNVGNGFASVCDSVHRGVSGRHHLGRHSSPLQDTSPWQTHPLPNQGRHPLGRHSHGQTPPSRHPLQQTPPANGHCSGRYASYLSAFLFTNKFSRLHWKGNKSAFSHVWNTDCIIPCNLWLQIWTVPWADYISGNSSQ